MAEHDKAINELREKHQTEITALKKMIEGLKVDGGVKKTETVEKPITRSENDSAEIHLVCRTEGKSFLLDLPKFGGDTVFLIIF